MQYCTRICIYLELRDNDPRVPKHVEY